MAWHGMAWHGMASDKMHALSVKSDIVDVTLVCDGHKQMRHFSCFQVFQMKAITGSLLTKVISESLLTKLSKETQSDLTYKECEETQRLEK